MQVYDYVVVGGGLAGSLLTWSLRAHTKVLLIDGHSSQVASRSAAGLTNPITGKRLVKSWKVDELLPKSKAVYEQFEKDFGLKLYHPTSIARVIPNEAIFQQWQPNFEAGIADGYIEPTIYDLSTHGLKPMRYFLIKKGFWVNIGKLLDDIHKRLSAEDTLRLGAVDYSAIQHFADRVELEIQGETITTRKVIFAEGSHVLQNPFFNDLYFRPNRGELMDIEVQNLTLPFVVKKNIFVIPLGASRFRVGATYDKDDLEWRTTSEGQSYLAQKLEDIGITDYSVLEQRVGVRPSTYNRRPFMGRHVNWSNLLIFNGFGAKGASLLPYFVEEFTDHLLKGRPIDEECRVRYV